MNFSWDEKKRVENRKIRNVDFVEAAAIFNNDVLESVDDRLAYGEERIQALGCIDGKYYMVVYTWRGDVRHIITAWKVGEDGKKRYQAYSLDEINQMRAKGDVYPTPADAPEYELDEAFWKHARIVEARPRRKTSVHLRLDPETLRFYRSAGRGHLTRMANILRAYAESKAAKISKSSSTPADRA